MRKVGLLTTAVLIGFAGAASAGCWGDSHEATAQVDMTPIPTADADGVTETPALPTLLLPLADGATDEG